MTVTQLPAARNISKAYCHVHSASAVHFGMHSFSGQCFKLLTASSETYIHCLVCELCSSAVSFKHPYIHPHPHTHVGEIINIFTRYFETQHFAVHYTATALSCVVQYPKKSVLYCILPKFSLVTLPEQPSIPQMLHHQARRFSESENVHYKKLIRQTFGFHITRTWTCQAKILIDSSTFPLVILR